MAGNGPCRRLAEMGGCERPTVAAYDRRRFASSCGARARVVRVCLRQMGVTLMARCVFPGDGVTAVVRQAAPERGGAAAGSAGGGEKDGIRQCSIGESGNVNALSAYP